jgi:hypothetical protein
VLKFSLLSPFLHGKITAHNFHNEGCLFGYNDLNTWVLQTKTRSDKIIVIQNYLKKKTNFFSVFNDFVYLVFWSKRIQFKNVFS